MQFAKRSNNRVLHFLSHLFIIFFIIKTFKNSIYISYLQFSIFLFTKVSFDLSEYTAEVDAVGCLRLLDAIRTCGMQNYVRFYQASTSELYGKVVETPQTEKTPFYPRSPYGN